MRKAVVYIHGAGGNAKEADHYKPLFVDSHIIGLEYSSQTPWEAQTEFKEFFHKISSEYDSVVLVANSIGAFFSMHALDDAGIEKAYFVSPIVDMEKLILDMLQWTGNDEKELKERGIIKTDFGQDLSWEYLSWVRSNPIKWTVPTAILHGGRDNMQSDSTVKDFAERIGSELTNWEDGEHWFHTEEQMRILDQWIKKC